MSRIPNLTAVISVGIGSQVEVIWTTRHEQQSFRGGGLTSCQKILPHGNGYLQPACTWVKTVLGTLRYGCVWSHTRQQHGREQATPGNPAQNKTRQEHAQNRMRPLSQIGRLQQGLFTPRLNVLMSMRVGKRSQCSPALAYLCCTKATRIG